MSNHQPFPQAAYDSRSLASLIRSGAATDKGTDRSIQQHRNSRGSSTFQAHPPHRIEVRDWLARPQQALPTKFQPIARTLTMALPLPHWIMQGYRPTLAQAMESFPFINPLQYLAPHKHGVLKFTNIPYNATKNELVAAIGGKAQIISQPAGSPFFAVHVIMERNSGKTMDAYVEVSSPAEAKSIADSFNRRFQQGRQLRIGDRVVEIRTATQADLMRDIFPCAKNVKWHGHVPQVTEERTMYYENVAALGFDGFVGSEEMVILAKFADTPARSPFAVNCPNRVYECMISTLHKYPWHSPRTTLLSDRKKIFDATVACVRSLCQSLSRPNNHPGLTEVLLQELAVAALGCPGLSEMQKSRIVSAMHFEAFGYVAAGAGMRVTLGGTARTAHHWPLLILIKRPGVDDALLDVFVDILVEATPGAAHYPTANQSTARPRSAASSDTRTSGSSGGTQRFGSMTIEYNTTDMGRLTLAEVAQIELDAIKDILFKMLYFGPQRTERALTLD